MKFLLLAFSVLLISCGSNVRIQKQKAFTLPQSVKEAVESEFRSSENKKRDIYRHPLETLEFFGVKPHMTIIEISPGAGWYMEILAPLLAEKGRYIMALPVADRPYFVTNEKKIKAWQAQYPMVGERMEQAIFSPPSRIDFPKAGTADMVLTFRNVHNWMASKGEKAAFKAFYEVLKPGGILGVVEHRARSGVNDPLAKSGYVSEGAVIKMASEAGFKLVEKSEINSNPKDKGNHPAGVWTLPPSLRLGEKDREKYLSIGESDRMTLKFMKPKK